VLHQCGIGAAATFAERWRDGIETTEFRTADGSGCVSVSISIGVSEYHPDMMSPEDLIAAADRALYRAKDAGRNRVEVATEL
jgi:diguanylate cyclase (GGDEF)-like protein